MGYTPELLIMKKDLDKHRDYLLNGKWQYDGSQDKLKGGEEGLSPLEYIKQAYERDENSFVKIGGIELILCTPEFSSFNREVRELLTDLKIEYATSY